MSEIDKEREYQKKKLELFTRNNGGIEKIKLSSLERSFLYSKYVKSESNGLLSELYDVFFKDHESMLNESLALMIFPYFTDQFLYSKKIEVEAEYFNKLKFKINDFGFSYEDYEKIEDFLKEPTGSYKEHGERKMTYQDLKLYSDLMKHLLLKTIEGIFIASIQDYTKKMSDEGKEKFFKLSKEESCVKKTEEMIKDLAFNYYPKIASLNFSDLFLLYNLEEEGVKLNIKKEDAVLFEEQENVINQFIQSFKNNKEKKIIIRSSDIHQIFVTKENQVINELEDNVEDEFRFLINKLMYDFEKPASIVVQERTGIYSQENVEQLKICGMIIHKGDFKVIEKDLLKQTYLKIMYNESVEEDRCYRFFNWLYDYIPDFN